MMALEGLRSLGEVAAFVTAGFLFLVQYWIPIAIGLAATFGLAYLSFLWRNLYLALSAGAVMLIGIGLISAYATGYQAHKAMTDKIMHEEREAALRLILAGKQDAIDELDRSNKELETQTAELNALLKEIRNVGPESKDNGPVAAVLSTTLRRLDSGVRKRPRSKPAH